MQLATQFCLPPTLHPRSLLALRHPMAASPAALSMADPPLPTKHSFAMAGAAATLLAVALPGLAWKNVPAWPLLLYRQMRPRCCGGPLQEPRRQMKAPGVGSPSANLQVVVQLAQLVAPPVEMEAAGHW